MAIWLLVRQSLGYDTSPINWAAGIERFGQARPLGGMSKLLKTLIWFTWPAWPIALWAVYAWRKQITLHIFLPGITVLIFLAAIPFTTASRDHLLLPLLPPLAILATFGLPTLKRGAINAIDWFSVMTLSAIASFIWLGWIAKQTGWPAPLAKNALKQVPGFQPEFNTFALFVALITSIGWILLLRWRLGRHPSVLWRAVVLSTGGIVLCWVLLMTLWLPWLNYRQSYAPVAEQLGARLPEKYNCVDSDNLGPAQRASFAYLGHVKFGRVGDTRCEFLLVQDNGLGRSGRQPQSVAPSLKLLWQGRREADKHELFRLFRRDSR
jgi:4-amino-4-deoxy-L-arabinose transferase-like glycosyltransferase